MYARIIHLDLGKAHANLDPMLNSSNVQLSCITFGAPPVFSADVTPLIRSLRPQASTPTFELAFVNEGDPIPRMDDSYAKLIALLHHRANAAEYGSARLQDLDPERLGFGIAANNVVTLPSPSLFRLGDIVMLADSNVDGDGLDLRLYLLREQQLGEVLLANFFDHKIIKYNNLASSVSAGQFNGRGGWESEPNGVA